MKVYELKEAPLYWNQSFAVAKPPREAFLEVWIALTKMTHGTKSAVLP